jgi:hypothetical protein
MPDQLCFSAHYGSFQPFGRLCAVESANADCGQLGTFVGRSFDGRAYAHAKPEYQKQLFVRRVPGEEGLDR